MSTVDFKKLGIQVVVGMLLFTIISVVLEGNYAQEVWLQKSLNGLFFGVAYAVFLILKDKFKKKEE